MLVSLHAYTEQHKDLQGKQDVCCTDFSSEGLVGAFSLIQHLLSSGTDAPEWSAVASVIDTAAAVIAHS